MADKTSEWRPGPTVCRCCLAEGCYKDISTEYFWMGKREVYAEMLAETFSVSIAYSKSGGPNSNSRLICEPCISRLRDASDFKKQVQECEKTFMQYLDPGSSSTTLESEVQTSSTDKRVKVEQVKIERQFSDDEFDSRDFGDDDDDDMDQPLTTFASKEPKKETVNLMELLASPQLSVKRKAPAQTKTVSVKKVKVIKKDARGKPTTSKAAQKNEDKKKKVFDKNKLARRNAVIVLKFSTVYPFRINGQNMVCVYCNAKYEAPAEYRRHMKEKHRFIRKLAYVHLKSPEAYMKVDCTEMSCSICSRKFDNVRAIAEHLRFAHGKTVTLHEEIAIHPYVFGEKLWACAICPMQLTCLRGLSIHTSTHFNRSTCETCGKSFVNSHSLQRHIAGAHYNEKICEKCKKRFPTNAERHKHLTESPACWRYICRVCGQRCMNQKRKDAHMREVHGQEKTRICTECGLQFTRWELYTHHFITTHTDRAYECTFCGLKLSTKKKFEDHKTVHTKEKPFDCHVCYKAFPTRKTLTQHMWVHSEYKRFECKMCDKKFTQKISWTCHMKSYHPDVNPK